MMALITVDKTKSKDIHAPLFLMETMPHKAFSQGCLVGYQFHLNAFT